MNAFVRATAAVLEVESLTLDDNFRAAPGWCSLQAFGLLVLLENDFGARVTIERFKELKTVRDLFREAFLAFAARVLGVARESLSGATAYGSIPEWDSVAHLRLAMEAEKAFEVYYPIERIPAMKTLDDFLVES